MELKTFVLANPADKQARHALVNEAVKRYYGDNAAVEYSPKGVPAIVGTEAQKYISITTCGEVMLCVVSSVQIGIDGEYLPRFKQSKLDTMAVAERFFSEDEAEFVRRGDGDMMRFVKVWTRKEAFVKYNATGVSDFPNFSVCDGDKFLGKVNGVSIKKFTIKFDGSEDYIFAIAGV